MRTKKQLEQEENKELQEKRERLLEKQFAEVGRAPDTAAAANAGKSPTKKNVQSNQKEFKIDDLPDGACFRPKSVLQSEGKGETAIKPVEVSYIIIACGYFLKFKPYLFSNWGNCYLSNLFRFDSLIGFLKSNC